MRKSVNIFRFKKFDVVNERSAMKVNTDGVLLGAVMTILSTDCRLLDIGTGTGTIALMAAQRLDSIADAADLQHRIVRIDAIDIDELSATEAAQNFVASPWAAMLHAHHVALDSFTSDIGTYDLIFSNPPYFEDSQLAPDSRKSTARHTGLNLPGRSSEGLSYRDIFDFAASRLTINGRVALILPADQEAALLRYARMSGLYLHKITRVRTVPRKEPSRIITEFSRNRCACPQEELLTIQNEGKYTEQYLSLTHDFYLFA